MCMRAPQAPEVLAGEPATFASDVFSFGTVMWEVACWQVRQRQHGSGQSSSSCVAWHGGRARVPPWDHLATTPTNPLQTCRHVQLPWEGMTNPWQVRQAQPAACASLRACMPGLGQGPST